MTFKRGGAAALLLAIGLLLAKIAAAQVQVTYVRPAKGPALTVFNAVTPTASASFTSSVYDFLGFSAVHMITTTSGSACATTRLRVDGAISSSGPFNTLTDPNADRTFGARSTLTTSVLTGQPYIRFRATGADTGCNLTLLVVPLAISDTVRATGDLATGTAVLGSTYPIIVGGVGSGNIYAMTVDTSGRPTVVGAGGAGSPAGGVLSIQGVASGTTVPVAQKSTTTTVAPTQVSIATTAGGTTAFTADATICRVTVQNAGTNAITCGETSAVVAGGPGMVLKAGGTNGDGQGGSWTQTNGSGIICIAVTGATNLNVQPEKCSGD